MLVNFKSKDLFENVKFILKKDNIEISDLDNINSINLNGKKINGEKTDVEISEINKLKNLESFVISNFTLKDEDIKCINTLKKLKIIQFENCDFKDVKEQINADIEYLTIEACSNFKIDKICKTKAIKSLKIYGCIVDIKEIRKFKNLNKLHIEGSHIINADKINTLNKLQEIVLERNI